MSRTSDMLDTAKEYLPENFVCKTDDGKLTAYLNLTLNDINACTPYTAYTLETCPVIWPNIISFGSTLFATMFLAANYTLKDFTYNDNGLSLTTDRQTRIVNQYNLQLGAYEKMKWNLKKAEAFKNGPAALGAPRYQSQVGQFMKILFGSSYYG